MVWVHTRCTGIMVHNALSICSVAFGKYNVYVVCIDRGNLEIWKKICLFDMAIPHVHKEDRTTDTPVESTP